MTRVYGEAEPLYDRQDRDARVLRVMERSADSEGPNEGLFWHLAPGEKTAGRG